MEEPIQERSAELSDREVEILRLVAEGLSNKEIAGRLFLSVNTVKVHLRNVFAKINVQSRTEATVYAIQQGLVVVPGATVGGDNGSAPTGEIAIAVPSITIEPPLPIGRRLALIGLAIISIGLALIARPPESVQSTSQAQPFSDSPSTGLPVRAAAGDTVWQAQSQMSLARGRLAVAAFGTRLIAIGGEAASGVTGAVEIYDTQTQRWQTGANKPTPVANVSAAVVSGTVIVPGGYTAAGLPTSVVEAYDPATDSWSTLAPLPAPRFAYSLAAWNDQLYLFGGWDTPGYVNTVYAYDPVANQWSTRAPLPIARGFTAAAALGNALYVVGGYADGHEFNTCDRYLPEKNQWETCAPLTVARGGLGLAVVGQKLYALGGGWTGYLTFSERYDPQTNSWGVIPTPFSGQWRGMGVATIGMDIYALGGWNGQYLSTVEKYSPFPFSIFVPAATSDK